MASRHFSIRIEETLLKRIDEIMTRVDGNKPVKFGGRSEVISTLLWEAISRRDELIGFPDNIARQRTRVEGHLKDGHVWKAPDED